MKTKEFIAKVEALGFLVYDGHCYLEVKEMEYRDELIEVQEEHQRDKDELAKVREELRGKQFEFDMATNRIEQLNKEIGGTAYESK